MMTTPNLEQIIAKAINDDGWTCDVHEPHDFGDCTSCRDIQLHTAAHVVAAIRDSGLTVIALPEADDADDDGSEWWVRKDSIVAEDGGVSLFAGTEPMGADNAAELGAAILAAAQVAERNNP
ncbi:hypothetical protein [Gordonia amicalis]|uniref:hypothetical protein n=1 Tax=Gordonia amicalis TaxID=89053 RepID=UPI0024BA8F24|nr:hypothetical protein [Gordonia amicalis]MDJ0454387.1 hypothetical protein [Gordonia amicalis]MDV7077724.1 hypothetical protein [Gordonia amicalis]